MATTVNFKILSILFFISIQIMLRVGTFNCQGLLDDTKKLDLVKDFCEYRLDVLCIQETHLKNDGFEKLALNSSENENIDFFYSGNEQSNYGVGIMVRNNVLCSFKKINERICYLENKCGNRTLVIICGYMHQHQM